MAHSQEIMDKIKSHIKQGLTTTEIAIETGVSIATINRMKKKYDLSFDSVNYKPLPTHPHYIINQVGELINTKTNKIIKPTIKRNREQFRLYDGRGKCSYKDVKRCVYEAWIGEVPKGMYVLTKHKNAISFTMDSLYLSTSSFSSQHVRTKKVILKKKNGKVLYYPSIKALATAHYHSEKYISDVVCGRRTTRLGVITYNK